MADRGDEDELYTGRDPLIEKCVLCPAEGELSSPGMRKCMCGGWL